jgi:hypothetical protein
MPQCTSSPTTMLDGVITAEFRVSVTPHNPYRGFEPVSAQSVEQEVGSSLDENFLGFENEGLGAAKSPYLNLIPRLVNAPTAMFRHCLLGAKQFECAIPIFLGLVRSFVIYLL